MSDMRTLGRDLAERVAARLIELQGERTDAQMAGILGCTHSHYWRIKNHQKFPSYAMVKRAGVVWPELLTIVIHDLTAPAAEVA